MKSQRRAILLVLSFTLIACTPSPPSVERAVTAPESAIGATKVASSGLTVPVKISIPSKLFDKVGPQAALYVTARPAGAAGGPPLAVKRFAHPIRFPLEFTLTDQDAMMPGSQLAGRLTINARISLRGPATPVLPGDPFGKAEVDAGSPAVIEINQIN